MRQPKNVVLFFIFLISGSIFSQNTLTVKVEDVASSEGYIAVGVYNTSDSFLKKGQAYTGAFETAKKGFTLITIPNLPNGTYAVSIFHDKNGNKKLDTNFLGIPRESCAFSNANMKLFGPPAFEDCVFEINADYEIVIPF